MSIDEVDFPFTCRSFLKAGGRHRTGPLASCKGERLVDRQSSTTRQAFRPDSAGGWQACIWSGIARSVRQLALAKSRLRRWLRQLPMRCSESLERRVAACRSNSNYQEVLP